MKNRPGDQRFAVWNAFETAARCGSWRTVKADHARHFSFSLCFFCVYVYLCVFVYIFIILFKCV